MLLLKKADSIITVSESLRKKLEKRSNKPSYLIRNIPPNADVCKENCHYWNERFNIPLDSKIIVHTGNAHYRNKRLHYLIDEVFERKNLALIFLGTNKSVDKIRKMALDKGAFNIYFHEQIPRKYVPYYCSQANFGLVYTWNPFWQSYWYALPNKLIDVSLAGIPVLSTSQPELKAFIDQYQHGVTFKGNSKACRHISQANRRRQLSAWSFGQADRSLFVANSNRPLRPAPVRRGSRPRSRRPS